MSAGPPGRAVAKSDGGESALQSMLPHVFDTLRREPAVAITLAYLLVAMAGIFYNYWFYRAFGIPVLTLSQISDFLVAGLQQPMALVLVLSTFPLCWLMDKVNARSRRKHLALIRELRALPTAGHWQAWRLRALEWRVGALWYTRLGYAAVVAAYGWTFVGLYAKARADALQRGEGARVEVWLNGEHDALPASSPAGWSYLGAVANYVFVYDRAGQRAVVLPVNAIARMEPHALPSGPAVFAAPAR
ncbi:hypothetical protein [Dokdonella fugitiva]|uniref:hypothetical protein n=1 Tax=Dokdonella fugitiva TaxID=328517 RepID=UPI0015F98F3A|nr:hypothetical protein [Dokdonella fugitiva]MBA8883790.1 hypothetical protein [Dokdonella fugitiva]